tara:strand:+ start:17 stop:388 length:372 start_codon:yes stop_codon:yes gene_type:complete
MWQLRKLSTNEPLSKVGPLPNNWGPIFGLHGFLDKIGDLSWVGPNYADKGWIKITEKELTAIRKKEIMDRVETEKTSAEIIINNPTITVQEKIAWLDYLQALNSVCLCPDFDCNPSFPIKPSL